jgi:hypothetical protein
MQKGLAPLAYLNVFSPELCVRRRMCVRGPPVETISNTITDSWFIKNICSKSE